MRTRLFISAFFMAVPLLLYSQDEIGSPKLKPSNTYWGIGYYANGNVSAGNDYVKSGSGNLGWGGTIEITYFDGRSEMFIIFSKNKSEIKESTSYYETAEFTIGPRFKLDKKGNYFAEISAGVIGCKKEQEIYYDFNGEYYYSYDDDMKYEFGITAGFGMKYRLNKNTALLFKTRLVTSLPVNSSSMLTYVTASTGIVFNNRETKTLKTKRAKSYFGAAVYAGLNSCDPMVKDNHSWSTGYGLEINYKISPLVEILMSGNYNTVEYRAGSYKPGSEMLSLTAGPRFCLNDNNVTAFFESGFGAYEFSNELRNIYGTENTEPDIERMPGISFGTGTKIKISEIIDMLFKGNYHLMLNERYSPAPDMFTLYGGVRYNF